MRLLERLSSHEIRLVGPFADENIPRYAILSHRWEKDPQQEVDYEDMISGQGRNKSGYNKIQFCAEQAFQDKLRYFWVDTCCINKSYAGEHQKAMYSMFRWYQRAERCYVYLADVYANKRKTPDQDKREWDKSIAGSEWFERGWTLQELVAPRSVEFFSHDRVRLGDKKSLQELLRKITGICSEALQGQLLTRFSANERFSWMERRKTRFEEDKVYALLGIFDVEIPIQYGQGWLGARQKLDDAIAAQDQIIQSLRITDPYHDKKRIEDTKGGLLPDVYCWVLENDDFKQWRHAAEHKVLWIRGDPGKGKTMLMCGIIDELGKIMPRQDLLAYFFCQSSDSRINNATAVLRGLLYMLVDQQPSLVSHMDRQYRRAGRALFEDVNSWIALTEIFSSILQDDRLMSTIFAVDGLDECVDELPKLLHFIARSSSSSPRVKWLVSSRNWLDIEQPFNKVERMLALRLELNPESVSEGIQFYIRRKVKQLALEKNYDKALKQEVIQHFLSNADGTFLWVALVCRSLCTVHSRYVRSKLDEFPSGLDPIYKRMVDQIDKDPDSADECHRILATVVLVSRPVTLKELGSLVTTQSDIPRNDQWLAELVRLCGFLTIRSDIIFFVHQSAKDYLLAKAGHIIHPAGSMQEHNRLALRCIQLLSSPGVLSDDLCKVRLPGARRAAFSTDDISRRLHPDVAYAGSYWASHVFHSKQELCDDGQVHRFLLQHFLHWLEALSWLGRLSTAVDDIVQLRSLVKETDGSFQEDCSSKLSVFLIDALRFFQINRHVIDLAPLQIYHSALAFAPGRSIVRKIFPCRCYEAFSLLPKVPYAWSAEILRLSSHSGSIGAVAFSLDGKMLASKSSWGDIRIWDTTTGKEKLMLLAPGFYSVAFSPDGRLLASISEDAVLIWNATTGDEMWRFEVHGIQHEAIAITLDGRLVAMANDGTVQMWDTITGEERQMLVGHETADCKVAISPDGQRLATASSSGAVQIRDLSIDLGWKELKGHKDEVLAVTFSPDGKLLVSASLDDTIRVWNASTGEERQRLQVEDDLYDTYVEAMAISPDGKLLVSTSESSNIARVWNIETGKERPGIGSHGYQVLAMAFSPNGQLLASASADGVVRIFNPSTSEELHDVEERNDDKTIDFVDISPDGKLIASASKDQTARILDTYSGKETQLLRGYDGATTVEFSPDSKFLALVRYNTAQLYDVLTDKERLLDGHDASYISAVAFSLDSKLLASADKTIRLWDVHTGEGMLKLEGHYDNVFFIAFSPDSKLLASASRDKTIRLWDVHTGEGMLTLGAHDYVVLALAFSPDCKLLASAAAGDGVVVQIWDIRNGEEREKFHAHTFFQSLKLAVDPKFLRAEARNFLLHHSGAWQDEGPERTATLQLAGEWVRCHGQDVLWLPFEYRGTCSASRGNMLVIGQSSGDLSIFRVAE